MANDKATLRPSEGDMNYVFEIRLSYRLDAYEQVTLKERLDREVKSCLADDDAEVIYLAKED